MAAPATRLLLILGFLWALPATVVGLLLAALSLGRGQWRNGALWVEANRGLGALVARRGSPGATTFGSVVLLWHPERLSPALEAHELVHVDQYRLLGVLFFPLYLALRLRFGSGESHPLERPAYRRQREVRGDG